MSGGSMDYIYSRVDEASRCFENPMMRELIKDVSVLLHDKEWADSGDYSDGEYNKTEKEFCEKWFDNHNKTVEAIIANEIGGLQDTLMRCIGKSLYCKDCVHWKRESDNYGRCKDNRWSTHGYEYGCDDWSEEE